MDIVRKIESLEKEELKKFVEDRIELLEQESIKHNPGIDTIGFHLDYNPTNYHLLEQEGIEKFEITVRCFYSGYISKGIRMVYGMEYHNVLLASNNGNYYYVDDDSYIEDFCKYIKNKEIQDEFELFDYILEYERNYFGVIKKEPEIDKMHNLILEKENFYFKPKEEHSFSSFKGKGNAMCTEYALMAQNLMSFFGIDSYFVIGKEEDNINGVENHAFNLIQFEKSDTKEIKNYLIDYSSPVKIYNPNYEEIGKSPFMGKIDKFNQEFIDDLLTKETHIPVEAYAYYILGNTLLKLGSNNYRDYYIDSQLINKEKSSISYKKML
ncbi:MAG: hypothetical protein IKE70_05455 [Bacilli bacterium]|nr:hypothetical protein [Bacilli bacterium]